MKSRAILSILCSAVLTACSEPPPRSTTYFEVHLDEAREVVASCRSGTTRGKECANADLAVQTAEARERRERFFR